MVRFNIPKIVHLHKYSSVAHDDRIDALILWFDHDSPELFYTNGKRNIVRISAKKGGIWHIYVKMFM
jgi:hypothetical protein